MARSKYKPGQTLVHEYRPYGASNALFRCRAEEVLIEGPAGTGKTLSVLEYINYLCETYPGIRVLMFRDTRSSMNESVLVTFEDEVLWEGHEARVGDAQRNNRSFYHYPNGSHIALGGMDFADRIMSTQYDIVACFEATEITQEAWEKVTSRLRHGVLPWQQGICDCNPGSQFHWLNQRANSVGSDGKPLMERLLSRHKDNPTLWDRDLKAWSDHGARYMKRLMNMHGANYGRLFQGLWVNEEGLIYHHWDPAIHVRKGFVSDAKDVRGLYSIVWGEAEDDMSDRTAWAHGQATRYEPTQIRWFFGSIDWGYRNPGVFQVWGVDGEGRMYLVAEHYHTQWTFTRWADEIERLVKRYDIRAITADPAEPRSIEMLNQHLGSKGGRSTPSIVRPADNAFHAGVLQVQDALSVQADGLPGMMFMQEALGARDQFLVENRQPLCTEQEMSGYVWLKVADGKPHKNKERSDPSVPDHGMDCLRYAAMFAWGKDLTPPDTRAQFASGTLGDLLGHTDVLNPKRRRRSR